METNNKFDVFISYSRKDLQEVLAIKERIESEIPGVNIWFDVDGIESGDEFEDKIITAIDKSNIVLFALSENSINSKWTKDEVMYARNVGKKIVPILLKGAKMKGWFLFKFGRVDCIDSINTVQMQKLITNISSWTGKTQKNEEKVESEPKSTSESKPEPLSQQKHKAEKKTIKPPPTPKQSRWRRSIFWISMAVISVLLQIFMVGACIGFLNDEEDSVSETLGENVEEDLIPLPDEDATYTANGVSFIMMEVEGGTFNMGATTKQVGEAEDDEKPVHKVTLSSYRIGQTEVTQELWEAVMGNNPSEFKGAKLPVECVSWDDCKEFVEKLNQLTGQKFRLPTEAEWEFAARGGNLSKGYKYSGSNTISDVSWCWDSSILGKTHEVASKQPNELGLYDMSGNVWEWCADWKGSYSRYAQADPTGLTSGSYHVIRGGSWNNDAVDCRVSNRDYFTPSGRHGSLGLRLAL